MSAVASSTAAPQHPPPPPPFSHEEVDAVAEMWTQAYTSTYHQFSKVEKVSEQEMFGELYNNIVHSPAIHTILNVEHSYSVALSEAVSRKDREVANTTAHIMTELDLIKNSVDETGNPLSDEAINQQYSRRFEELEILQSKWESELSLLRDTQKSEFREWINTVAEDLHSSASSDSKLSYSDSSTNFSTSRHAEPAMEESFTIYLGTQLKTMHNIRLLTMDAMDLCRSNTVEEGGTITQDPKRMQTALTLYSDNLSALVLIVGNRLTESSNEKRALSKICGETCEFHFPELDQQLETIADEVVRLNLNVRHPSLTALNDDCSNDLSAQVSAGGGGLDSDQNSISSVGSWTSHPSSQSRGGLPANMTPQMERRVKSLQPGDVYITRHSNLAAVHTIFHLVGDPKVDAFTMTSQHPTFSGLRNIFRLAIDNDIINIYIPLLLTNDLAEDKSFELCVRRAELVFKCVKGYMIEATTWTTAKSRTIQFMLPTKASPELFDQLSSLLQETFPICNPAVVGRSSDST